MNCRSIPFLYTRSFARPRSSRKTEGASRSSGKQPYCFDRRALYVPLSLTLRAVRCTSPSVVPALPDRSPHRSLRILRARHGDLGNFIYIAERTSERSEPRRRRRSGGRRSWRQSAEVVGAGPGALGQQPDQPGLEAPQQAARQADGIKRMSSPVSDSAVRKAWRGKRGRWPLRLSGTSAA